MISHLPSWQEFAFVFFRVCLSVCLFVRLFVCFLVFMDLRLEVYDSPTPFI